MTGIDVVNLVERLNEHNGGSNVDNIHVIYLDKSEEDFSFTLDQINTLINEDENMKNILIATKDGDTLDIFRFSGESLCSCGYNLEFCIKNKDENTNLFELMSDKLYDLVKVFTGDDLLEIVVHGHLRESSEFRDKWIGDKGLKLNPEFVRKDLEEICKDIKKFEDGLGLTLYINSFDTETYVAVRFFISNSVYSDNKMTFSIMGSGIDASTTEEEHVDD